ncbi:inverse autotransporter beta domain-containing protein [Thorsellia anophelis]|uniref:Invasin beta-domain of outer membrane n=1 Tax=Thorsellia anophelis DSM 18579 TaxID=1123402 RepID=A0A1I0B552_9GAMM|nr:inverse autotransporter beta domain-containing protein [Thorsellia anophelis]SET01638.1 Invasin beta-domain of outer membrane [Thorsellia anophelis DSM 18579]
MKSHSWTRTNIKWVVGAVVQSARNSLCLAITMAAYLPFSVHANLSESLVNAEQNQTVSYRLVEETSLYQLALQSQITIDDLRALNHGNLDNRTHLKAGEQLLLPANSSLVANIKLNTPEAINLPDLGGASGKQVKQKNGSEVILQAQELGESLVEQTPLTPLLAETAEERLAKSAVYVIDKGWENFSIDKLEQSAESWATSRAKSAVMQPIQQGANELLGKFGKAQSTISIDEKGSLKGSSFSLLSPIFDNNESLIFAQTGVHQQGSGDEDRLIGNFGLGYRYDTDAYLVGANAFFDHDFTGYNSRLGLGTELWMDNAKLSANYYMPLSDWRDSKVLENFEERAAEGFDVRAQGYLPSYPQLGASAVFEQYFGDQVALFGVNDRQKDPYAATIGIDYTPVPLLTLKASQKFGQEGKTDTRLDLNLNLQVGKPIEEQLDPNNVALARSLKGSRYDLVDRNYDIVLEYREKPNNSIKLASEVVLEYTTKELSIQNSELTAPSNVEWDVVYQGIPVNPDSFLSYDAGNWEFNAPDWKRSSDPEMNKYYVTMTVNLSDGEQLVSNEAVVTVIPDRGGFIKTIRGAAFTNNEDYTLKSDTDGDGFDDYTTYFEAWATRPTDRLNDDNTKVYENDIDAIPRFSFYLNDRDITNELKGRYAYQDEDNDGLWELTLSYQYASDVTVKVDFDSEDFDYREAVAEANFVSLKGPYTVLIFDQGPDGMAINLKRQLQDDEPIKPDTYYRAEIRDENGTDVTRFFIDTLRWRYFNPETGTTDDLPSWISRCDNKAMFSTQITNNKNNDLSPTITGSLVDGMDGVIPTPNEQGLQLYIEYNPSKPKLNSPTPTNGNASRCSDFKYVA